ncbi:MAG: SUMF1/EgtB/PvdO family nonheme iron enzyme, partial [Planctomycetes bacterium]|nr:SUMF1/EgtB/PvdO family nonheme iron enzyme [Planctomycetota bacterium]
DGDLTIHVTPTAERATIHRYESRERILRPIARRALTGDPLTWGGIPLGRYRVKIEAVGRRPIVAPVCIGRCESVLLKWRLRTEEEIGRDFVQIPSGSFVRGGDPDTMKSAPLARPFVKEFAIGRFSITWSEYLEFLNAIHRASPAAAARRVPRVADGGGAFRWIERRRKGYRLLALSDAPRPFVHAKWPVFGVSHRDAMAYARWRSERDGRRYRLPSGDEWEKAARGVDGRLFPWGDEYDASFAKNLGSTPGKARPEPIGAYRADVSPYGVRDMAGGVRDWCRSWYDARQNQRLVRGGAWNQSEVSAHCAYRNGIPPDQVTPFQGFRLVHHFG